MINFLKQQRAVILIVLLLFVVHLFSKDVTNPYERPISGDAQAYYAYLPALFIYQDLDYKFMKEQAAQYYAEGALKDFIVDVDGESVNKTFPGVAVLYTPFFVAAHISAKILGKPTDGFSSIYQLWFDIGHWFYFLLGLVFMRKLLEKLSFSSKTAIICVFFIAFGTNMFFYTIYDQSVTHVHNFFMINGLLLCLFNFKNDNKLKWLLFAFGLLALIGITRPTNILVFGLIIFFFPSLDFYKSIFKRVFSKDVWKFALIVLPILMLPLALWKAQTGHWIVYSYGEEGFDFTEPHFAEFLFSYTKGWMTYTPIVIPILVGGLVLLFRENKKQFGIALLFYIITIYIFSSWWCWYYGAGMSQRVMIDHYILLAFLLATVLKFVWQRQALKIATLSIFSFLTVFNVAQAYQIRYGILKNGSATAEQYWENFMVFQQKARVYPTESWQNVEQINFSKLTPIKGDFSYDAHLNWVTEVKSGQVYSSSSGEPINELSKGSKVVLSFEAKALTKVSDTRAVMIFNPSNNTNNEVVIPFYLKGFTVQDQWIQMEFLFEPLESYSDSVKIYFWNGDTDEKVQFKNLKYRSYFSNEYM